MSPSPRRARFATAVFFLVHGLVVATWVSRIPTVQVDLGLSSGVLGLTLLAIAIGSMIAMPITGALIGRFGSRRCAVASTLLFCAALAIIPFATDALTLGALLFLYGATAGSMDVSMNSQGVTVESFYGGRSVMSGFHALFSLGGMIGAGLGGQIAAAGIPVLPHFLVSAVVNAALSIAVGGLLIGPAHEPLHESGPVFAMPRGPVLALGLVAFCILLGEGAIADWTAIYLRDAVGAGPAGAASGYAVFSAAMSAGRFAGDWVTDKVGAVHVIRWGSLLAAAGLVAALLSGSLQPALIGLFAVGIGYAAIVPNLFGAAGRINGVPSGAGIAAVTTMGFTGFLIGPPVIGWIAEWTSLRAGLFVLVALSLAGSLLAGAVRVARSPGARPAGEVWEVHG